MVSTSLSWKEIRNQKTVWKLINTSSPPTSTNSTFSRFVLPLSSNVLRISRDLLLEQRKRVYLSRGTRGKQTLPSLSAYIFTSEQSIYEFFFTDKEVDKFISQRISQCINQCINQFIEALTKVFTKQAFFQCIHQICSPISVYDQPSATTRRSLHSPLEGLCASSPHPARQCFPIT